MSDIIKYRCAASAEKTKYLCTFGDRIQEAVESHKAAVEWCSHYDGALIWSRKEVQPLEFALQACKTTLDALCTKLEPSTVSIYLSPDRTFRHSIAVSRPYKGNRTQPKPKYLKEVEEYLVKNHGAIVAQNIEADDEIGRALSLEMDAAVSVSIDKDLLQISGWHYDWVNDRVRWISPRDADINFYSQMLTGDATDNIPGLQGYGLRAAARILNGVGSRADAATRVWGHYRDKSDDSSQAKRYFREQAALLWILRQDEYSETSGGYKCPIELS